MSHVHISRNKLDDNLTIRELTHHQAQVHREMDVHTRNPDVGVVLQQLALQPNVGRGCKNGEGQDLAELGSHHVV
jgi:hypothetical protein